MSGAFLNTRKIGLTFLSVLGLFIGSLSWMDETLASGGFEGRYGQIMARGLFLSDNGNPIIIEMGPGGEEVRQISEAIGEYENPLFLDAAAYNNIVSVFDNFKTQNRNGIAAGATVMTREAYEAADFGMVSVPLLNVQQGQPTHQDIAIPKGRLEASTRSVYYRAKETIPDPRLLPAGQGNILFQAPVDLRNAQQIDPAQRSVLLDKTGRVRATSPYRIGYKTGYLKDPTKSYREREALGPVVGIMVEATGHTYSPGVTDDEGRYGAMLIFSPCPGFSWFYDFYIVANIPVIDFDPESPTPLDYYPFLFPDGYLCWGFGEESVFSIPPSWSPIGGSVSYGAQDFAVDLAMFKGFGFVTDENGVELPQGETKYAYTPPNLTRSQPVYLDLNADRTLDAATASATDPRYYDVYLDGSTTGPDNQPRSADLQQVGDNHYTLGYQNQGLLESISFEDLKKTDFYLYRVSTGQRITKIAGLQDKRVLENRGGFNYSFTIPGPTGFAYFGTGGGSRAFQEDIGMPQDMIGREGDFMRPGEQIKIIAVNRPTGYIATTTTTMQTPTYGFLYFPDGTLQLRPPNLKVKVDRIYTVEAGLSQGDKKDYTVGFEGSALTTDTMVSISTEWFDHDGTPLPDDLDGYTGRLAKVTGANSIAGGTVNNFEIKPGQHLQVLKFTGDILGSEHFYVHVFGDKPWDVSSGAGNGPLQFRPDRYVPIKVPIFDEIATRLSRNANTYNQQDGNPSLSHVDAVYRWPYRPEMQFSVFDLTVNEIQRTDSEGVVHTVTTANGLGDFSSDDLLDIFYDLTMPANDALPEFGPPRELVFSLGGSEVLVTPGDNTWVNFFDLSYLSKIEAGELLTLQLYQNSDAENILWEMPVRGLYVVSSDEPDSRKKKSFIVKDEARFAGSLINAAILPQPPKIEVTLVTGLNEGDEVEWKVEALQGGHSGEGETDDLPSSVSDSTNKPYAYGKIKDNNLTARTGLPADNDGRYTFPWYSKRYKPNESGKTIKFNPDPPTHLPSQYCRKLDEAGCTRVGGTRMIDVNTANPRYGYKVSVRIFRNTGEIEEETTTVRIDDKDMIRQEYADLIATVKNMSPYTNFGAMFQQLAHVPTRDELEDKNSFGDILRGAWSQSLYQYMLPGNMVEMTNGLKEKVQAQASQTVSVQDQILLNTPIETIIPAGADVSPALHMNSGWRNPERNERVGGVWTSRHMYGRAIDVGTDVYERDTRDRALLMWVQWNSTDGGVTGARRWILERAVDGESLQALLNQVVGDARPAIEPDDQTGGGLLGDEPDGIWDDFNDATHLHVESNP